MTKLIERSAIRFLACVFLFVPFLIHAQTTSAPGYDVFLLVGQSNMEGTGTGVDSILDASVNARIAQWDSVSNQIIPAVDPFYTYQGTRNLVGLGLTFAKSYLTTIPSNRQVLLVNAAAGGTGFTGGFWIAGSGSGATTAVQYANAAMAEAGPGARLVGILWDQGEADVTGTDATAYQTDLSNLISYFRSNITGATSTTPFVVGELTSPWLASMVNDPTYGPQQYTIMEDLHSLPDTVPYTSWTSGEVLPSDLINGLVHYSASSQRAYGRRFAQRFFQAANGLPQPQVSLQSYAGAFYDDGRGLLSLSALPTNLSPTVTGTVLPVVDPLRGNAAQISQAQGFLIETIPATVFNASYTKMVWFRAGSSGYTNQLISASNPGQTHFLQAQTSGNSLTISAGHSNGPATANVQATLPIESGTSMQIAVVYDANAQKMTLYLNGVDIASQTGVAAAPATTISSATLPVYMGSLTGAGNGGVDGVMASNRVWTTALTGAQVASLYSFEVDSVSAALVFENVSATTPVTESYNFVPTNGAAIISISVVTEGVAGGDYSLAGNSTCAVGVSDSCTASVTFTPQFGGLRRGAMLITDSSGEQTTVFLSGTNTLTPSYKSPVQSVLATGLASPSGVAVDGAGDVYSANLGAGTVTEVNASGTQVRTISGLNAPWGVAVDGAGDIYISQSASGNVVRVLPNATNFNTVINGLVASSAPQGLTSDAAGNIYVADTYNSLINEITSAGTVQIVTTGSLSLSAPTGLAIDAAGNLYIADSGNARIVEVPATGAANTSVYATGFQKPTSVALDAMGDLFVTDSTANALYELPAGSQSLMPLGNGFSGDSSVAVGANGNVYVADTGNGRIVQLQRSSIVKSNQTVTFGAVPSQTAGTTYALSASASSGLPVTFTSSTAAVCTVSGSTVSLTNIGTCTIAAGQPGNGIYTSAIPVSQSFAVNGTGAGAIPPVNVSSSGFNVYAAVKDGTSAANGGLDGSGYALSLNLLGPSLTWSGVTFSFGASGTANGDTSVTLPLPAGIYSSLKFLATAVYGSQTAQSFVVTYTDGTTSTFTQGISDWGAPSGFIGETIVSTMPYRVTPNGSTQAASWHLYGYSIPLNPSKTAKSLTLPSNRDVVLLSIAVVPAESITAVNLASINNLYAIANDGTANSGVGKDGYSYSANQLGTSANWSGETFVYGTASAPNAVTSKTIMLPSGTFNTLSLLGTGIYGNQVNQMFTVNYTDGTTAKFTQSVSDWGSTSGNTGEAVVAPTAYRITPSGDLQNGPWNLYGYTFTLDTTRAVQSLTLPSNTHVAVLAIDLANTLGSSLSQTITFTSVPAQTAGSTFSLANDVSASSGLSVTLTSNSSNVCTVSGITVSLLSAGTCSITATQAGNNFYTAAAAITQAIMVTSAIVPSFALSALPAVLYVTPGAAVTSQVTVSSLNGFMGAVALGASGLPAGVTASFSAISAGTSTLTLTAAASAPMTTSAATIQVTGASSALMSAAPLLLTVTSTSLFAPVSLMSVANRYAIANNGTSNGGLEADGYSYSANLIGSSVLWNGRSFTLGNASAPSGVTSATIPLPAGTYTSLSFLATGLYGSQLNQVFTVTYTDGTTASFTQNLSDWGASQNYIGESVALSSAYRVTPNGSTQGDLWDLYGYTFAIDGTRTVQSLTLPNNSYVVVLAVTLGNVQPTAPAVSSYSTICQAGTYGTFCSDQNPGPADSNGYHDLPSWVNLNKNLAAIAVSDNQIWGVDSNGILWFLPNFKTGTSWTMVSSGVTQISAGHGLLCQINANQHVYCASSPNPLLSPADANGFHQIPWVDTGAANFKQIAVSVGTQFWGVDTGANLIQVKDYTHLEASSTMVAPNVQQVAVDGRGVVCILGTNQAISCSNWSAPSATANPAPYFSLPFVQTTASLVTIAVVDGVVLGTDTNGNIYELPDYTNSSTWFPIAHGTVGTQLAGASIPSQYTSSQFASNDVAVLIFMGQSNAVGINSQPARFISPSSPNVWGVQNGGWNFLPGNTNGTTPFTSAISTISSVGFSNFALTPTSADMDLGFNTAGGPGGDAANFSAYQWQGLINAGWQLPDLYVIHIAWPSQGVDPQDVYYGSAAWTTHGVNLWQPLLATSQQPSYALAPFSRVILYRAMQALLANGKTPRILGLQWNQWEAEAGNPNPVSIMDAPVNYENLFNGFFAALGSHYPVQFVKPLSTAYGATQLAQMQAAFANLSATEVNNLSMIDISQVSNTIFSGGVLGGGDGSIHYNLDTHQWFAKQAIGTCILQANCGTRITTLPASAPN